MKLSSLIVFSSLLSLGSTTARCSDWQISEIYSNFDSPGLCIDAGETSCASDVANYVLYILQQPD